MGARNHAEAVLGVSPRGSVALQRAAQALALIHERTFVIPDDVKSIAPAVMAHRVLTRGPRPEAAHDLVADVLAQVEVPL